MNKTPKKMTRIYTAVRPALMTIVALFIAMIATSIVHLAFSFVLAPFPQKELMEALPEQKAAVMQAYMTSEPRAIYTALFAHGFGGFVGVFTVLLANRSWDEKRGIARPQWVAPLIVGAFWLYADLSNDLNDAPIGPLWTVLDVLLSLGMAFLGYLLANRVASRTAQSVVKRS